MAFHGSVLIPTYTGHLEQVTALVRSIRGAGNLQVEIVLVVGRDERPAFEPLVQEAACRLLDIEALVHDYTGTRIGAAPLLAAVERFRFQALKKLLGVASLRGDVLVLDSESCTTRDLSPIFEGGLAQTSVVYSERPWHKLPGSLTTQVYDECCQLLGQQPYWFFESFNWLYSSELTRQLLAQLKTAHGPDWVFRPKPLFECQLYFQFAYARNAGYRFISAREVLVGHFGAARADALLATIFASPQAAFGIFEYLARFLTREDYLGFVGDPGVIRHFRFMRHEPYEFYDVVGAVRSRAGADPNYFGEASMHRGPLVRGRIAVLVAGRFHGEQEVYGMRQFLRGVECDLFIGSPEDAWLDGLLRDVLHPRQIAMAPDEPALGLRHRQIMAAAGAVERKVKPLRDVGSMAMFDKIAAAWQALCDEERATGQRYAAVIRIRPDIFCARGLRDVLWELSEHMASLRGALFVPDRFWSQGINDQLFLGLRDEMGRLLDGLDGAAYTASDYLNPEYFLARRLRQHGLKPVTFPLEYLLTRGHPPDLHDIGPQFENQQRIFWSGPAPVPLWKDAGAALDRMLANTALKNGQMKLATVSAVMGGQLEYLYARAADGRRYVLVSEYKSPSVHLVGLPRGLLALAPYALAAGLLRPRHGQAVALESHNPETGQLLLRRMPRPGGHSPAGAGPAAIEAEPPIALQVLPPQRSMLLALLRWSRSALRATIRLGRRALRGA
jgi:hypothetical protein